MALSSLKIVSSDYTGKDISGLADVVSGQASTLKARFDSLVKDLVATRFNSLIDELDKSWTVATTSAGWSSDSSMTGYAYKQTLSCSGATSDMTLCVSTDITSAGKLCAIANSVTNGCEIWSNDNTLVCTCSVKVI